jgi:hypothetical protein
MVCGCTYPRPVVVVDVVGAVIYFLAVVFADVTMTAVVFFVVSLAIGFILAATSAAFVIAVWSAAAPTLVQWPSWMTSPWWRVRDKTMTTFPP